VGDSPTKDVAMAQDVGISDVYARYGRAQHTEAYDLLREVTHWSDADVEREKRSVNERCDRVQFLTPILDKCSIIFVTGIGMDNDERKNIIEIWKAVVGVQQHFNEIEMKVRGLFITIVVTIAAAQGFLIEKKLSVSLGRFTILYANVMPWLGILATYLFYFVDRHWYHRLLMGSILHGGSIERKYATEIPELGLGAKITEQSPVELKSWLARKVADIVVSDERWVKHKRLHSDAKIEFFYKSIVLLFFCWFVATVLFAGVLVDQHSLFENLLKLAPPTVQP
jgi:hypothetical protein